MEKTFSCCKRGEEWNYHLPTSTMPKRLQNFQLNSIDFSISCTAKRNVRVYFTKSSIFILQQRTFFWSSTKLFKDIQCFVSARAWHNLWFLLAQKSLSLSEMVFTIGLDPREREKCRKKTEWNCLSSRKNRIETNVLEYFLLLISCSTSKPGAR